MGVRKTHCKNGHPRTPENLFANNSCKACSGAATKAWQQAHPERVKAYNDEHQRQKKANPEGVRAYWLMNRYGLSLERYKQMLVVQDGKCAICKRLMDKPKVDHDHETGQTRDLLCNECNAGIGFLRDDLHIAVSAVEYLTRWKHAIN
jgi:hypothetical protein